MSSSAGSFRFHVSDAAAVPLRGWLLRLKLVGGAPSMKRIKKEGRLRLVSPDGSERTVAIKDFSTTGGRPSQKRLEETGELDVVIAEADAVRDGRAVDIGWEVRGPGGRVTREREA